MNPVALVVPAHWVEALTHEDENIYNYSVGAADFVAFIEFARDHLHLGSFTVDENSMPYYCELHDAAEYNMAGCEVLDTVFTPYY